MNWLIISSEENDSNLQNIQAFLKEKLSSPKVVFTKDLASKDDLSVETSLVLDATHVAVFDGGSQNDGPEFTYLLGLALGKGCPVFVCSSSSSRYAGSFVKKFSSPEALLADVKSDYDDFLAKEERHAALTQLFAAGIPFTTDCFATYIAKDDDEKCTQFYKAGMLVDSRDSLGVPMLCIATRNDCFEKVKWLVEKGADINAVAADRGYTAVMDAVWRKNPDVTKYLIDSGADLSVISSDGQSILVLAVGNGNTKIIDMLLASGADPDIKDGMGMSARQYAELFKKEPILEVFRRYSK